MDDFLSCMTFCCQNQPFLAETEMHGPHPKQKTKCFSEITKPDPKLSKPFHFNKISYVLAVL